MTLPAEDRPTVVPPVVAVMVVHEPGDWFAEALAGLAAQEYPDLRLVTLLTGGTSAAVGDLIRQHVPTAIVRQVEGNPGFGPIVNQTLSLVKGTAGFFLVLHDDVLLRPDAVSRLVEEADRSNAAIVGPKLVEWESPDVLQHVGLEADRAGRLVDVVDPGERDQEQHDAVRDVFALPSACLLVRNDVFREVSGFAPNVPFLGEELDLCWRVHLLGARVVVNPAAVARHRGAFATRANLVHEEASRQRHRVRTALSCVSAGRLPLLVVRLVLGALLDVVLETANGRYQDGLASAKAVAGVFVDIPLIAGRRRELRALRRVPSREVVSLQLRGSARIVGFRRHRRALREQHMSESPSVSSEPVTTARGVAVVGLLAVLFLVIANRGLVLNGVSGVGQFVPLVPGDSSPIDAMRAYVSGWSPGWFGATGPAPTFVGLIAVLGAVFLGNWGGLLTAIVVGALFVGALGAWRLCGSIGGASARMFGALVYVAVPVGVLAIRDGRRDSLIIWALLPWIVDFSRRIAGLSRDTQDPGREVSVRAAGDRRVQLLASLLLVVASASAFTPAALVVVVFLGCILLVSGAVTATPLRASVWLAGAPLLSVLGSAILHVPWSVRFVADDWWQSLVGPPRPVMGSSVADVLSFGIDNTVWRWLVLAAYVPVVVMPIVTRGARAVWPTRAMLFVMVPVLVRMAQERGLWTFGTPEPLMLSALVSLGIAIAATSAFVEVLAARRTTFTWRGVAGVVSVVAVCAAGSPTVVAGGSGRWSQPADTLGRLVEQLPGDQDGDYSVLYIGDPRLLPVASVSAGNEVAYGVLHDGGASGVDTLTPPTSSMTVSLSRAVEVLLDGESLRAGRLFAPLAVRFVVVPLRDATLFARSAESGRVVGESLVARLSDQLDFRRIYTATDLVIFENVSALPVAAVLDEQSSVVSRQATESKLFAEPLGFDSAFVSGFTAEGTNSGQLESGTIHIAAPYSDRWSLRVDGAAVAPRIAFGATTAFDAPVDGTAVVRLRSSLSHRLLVALQATLWLLVVAITFNPSRFRGRVRAARNVVEVSLRSEDQRTGVR